MTAPRPFIKWAGGKGALLPELLKRAPAKFDTYHEPFVGGGALFFALQPKSAVLSDTNARLVRTYAAVRDHVENVIGLLEEHQDLHRKYGRDHYMRTREVAVDNLGDVGVAAWFIYLNRTCFNGLYRVNRANRFNVPMGDYPLDRTICDADNLRACSAALKSTYIYHADFRNVGGSRGTFVYADPPYAPLSPTSNFTSYTKDRFDHVDQVALRDMALALKRNGADVMISNSSADSIREIYGGGRFTVEEVSARRNINSNGSKRGAVKELIIR